MRFAVTAASLLMITVAHQLAVCMHDTHCAIVNHDDDERVQTAHSLHMASASQCSQHVIGIAYNTSQSFN